MVSPLAPAHAAPNPPEPPTRLEWSTRHNRESNRGKKSILSLRSRRPLSAASHQPAETLAGVGAGSGPPAQPSWEPGKAVVLLWQRASPSSERKDTQKRNISLFHLENPSAISVWWLGKVFPGARGRGGERMHWVVSYQTPQVTLLARPAFIYFTAAELVVIRFLPPQPFVKPSPRENKSHPCATARSPRGSFQGALAASAPTHQASLGMVGFKKPSTKQHHRFLFFFF